MVKTKTTIEVPGGARKILLHACCAPCSGAIVEWLVEHGHRPVVFYSNYNIVPQEEYDHRLNECIRYARKWGLEIVEDNYDHCAWQGAIAGLEDQPER
ncbi:MAG: epoxyqueuosine reductase QueH, partial [Bacteroidales bacterium]|nr:epoxyqueuosine reductase QueH [Bacteroidales bacterium]